MIKRRNITLWALFLCATAVVALATSSTHAEEATDEPAIGLQISPTSTTMDLSPGDQYDGEFTVSNIGPEATSFKVQASPFSVTDGEYGHNYLDEKPYNQIARWITIPQVEFTIPAGEKQVVQYHINVPVDAPGGSQHAAIFAEPVSAESNSESGSGIEAIPRAGVRIVAKVAGQTREGVEITNYEVPKLYISFDGADVTATSRVKNTGNVDAGATFSLQIAPFFGGEKVFIKNEPALIYPDSEYTSKTVWGNTPLLGLFNVTYTVTVGDVVREESFVVFVMPAWLLIIIFILLTFLIIWLILKIRKRQELRSKLKL